MSISIGVPPLTLVTDLTFASETVTLPASHPDVKRYRAKANSAQAVESAQGQSTNPIDLSDPAQNAALLPLQADSHTASNAVIPVATASAGTIDTDTTKGLTSLSTTKDKPRPGSVKRKRPRQSLESMNAELNRQAAAAKKMSTFEKVCGDITAMSTFSYKGPLDLFQ